MAQAKRVVIHNHLSQARDGDPSGLRAKMAGYASEYKDISAQKEAMRAANHGGSMSSGDRQQWHDLNRRQSQLLSLASSAHEREHGERVGGETAMYLAGRRLGR
jgi:hypothetical protein